jgi:hypothetical protein
MNNPEPWWLTWPVAEVGAAILPLFSYTASEPAARVTKGIVAWFMTGSYRPLPLTGGESSSPFNDPHSLAVAEAIQALQHAGLLLRVSYSNSNGDEVGLTRLGRHALATNTVRQHLGLGEAPPQPESN